MDKISLIDYAFVSAQGDAKETLQAIQNNTLRIGSKEVATLEDKTTIPYFLLPQSVAEDPQQILEAIKKVVTQITDKLSSEEKKETALFIGTALVDMNLIDSIATTLYSEPQTKYATVKKSIDSYAREISFSLGLHPFTMTINTACTSSMNAVLEARNLINSGVFSQAIVVGVEIFSEMMSSGFSSMKLLSATTQKPFDTSRDGLVLGEAIAAVLISQEKSQWTLLGGYSNCDSVNITSVSAGGEEYTQVMRNALERAAVTSEDITALKAHATSTPTNDLSEINAIEKLFGTDLVFTALKPYLGHTLGACGVLELAVFMSCIDTGFLPKTLHHQDTIIPGYTPLQDHKECHNGTFMLNYFGFGGNNTSVIIRKEAL